MRLINVDTLCFKVFFDSDIPTYAILSHTWGEEEVTFKDWTDSTLSQQPGSGYQIPSRPELYISGPAAALAGVNKVLGWCDKAREQGFEWAWIDTCCIDKSSSAELSEAINSMFRWYANAELCYAYLSDVDSAEDPKIKGSSFCSSRWFTRGWTLQELIAPKGVIFLASDWKEIGTRQSLAETVHGITKIDHDVLDEPRLREQCSDAQKMSWASQRCTSRIEDEAYCLLGIFNVNMPLIYGEGQNAFIRLQQIILDGSQDCTLLSWRELELPNSPADSTGVLADSPHYFSHCRNFTAPKTRGANRISMNASRQTVDITTQLCGPLACVEPEEGVPNMPPVLFEFVHERGIAFHTESRDSVQIRQGNRIYDHIKPPRGIPFLSAVVWPIYILFCAVIWRRCPLVKSPNARHRVYIGVILLKREPFRRLQPSTLIEVDLEFQCFCKLSNDAYDIERILQQRPSTQIQAQSTWKDRDSDKDQRPRELTMSMPIGLSVVPSQEVVYGHHLSTSPHLYGQEFKVSTVFDHFHRPIFFVGATISTGLAFVLQGGFDNQRAGENIILLKYGSNDVYLNDGTWIVFKRTRGASHDIYHITLKHILAIS